MGEGDFATGDVAHHVNWVGDGGHEGHNVAWAQPSRLHVVGGDDVSRGFGEFGRDVVVERGGRRGGMASDEVVVFDGAKREALVRLGNPFLDCDGSCAEEDPIAAFVGAEAYFTTCQGLRRGRGADEGRGVLGVTPAWVGSRAGLHIDQSFSDEGVELNSGCALVGFCQGG